MSNFIKIWLAICLVSLFVSALWALKGDTAECFVDGGRGIVCKICGEWQRVRTQKQLQELKESCQKIK